MHHLKIPTSPKLVHKPSKAHGRPPKQSWCHPPDYPLYLQKRSYTDSKKKWQLTGIADTFDNPPSPNLSQGGVVDAFRTSEQSCLGHPQNVISPYINYGSCCMIHTWLVTWSEHWAWQWPCCSWGLTRLAHASPKPLLSDSKKGSATPMGVGGSRAFPLHHVWICGPAPTLQA